MLTSNQHYGGLNRRFDKRARLLKRFGWTYECVLPYRVGVFVRSRYHKTQAIAASGVMNMCRRNWQDLLGRELHRPIGSI